MTNTPLGENSPAIIPPVIIIGATKTGLMALRVLARNGHDMYGFLASGAQDKGINPATQSAVKSHDPAFVPALLVLGEADSETIRHWQDQEAHGARVHFFVATEQLEETKSYLDELPAHRLNAIDPSALLGLEGNFGYNLLLDVGVSLGYGVELDHSCVLGAYTCLGDGVQLGAGCRIQPMAVLGDKVHLEENVLVGAHAYIAPGVLVGRDACIGPGAIVTSNVPEGAVVSR